MNAQKRRLRLEQHKREAERLVSEKRLLKAAERVGPTTARVTCAIPAPFLGDGYGAARTSQTAAEKALCFRKAQPYENRNKPD